MPSNMLIFVRLWGGPYYHLPPHGIPVFVNIYISLHEQTYNTISLRL